ncbi:MAG: BolA/IbaG family iron-sulfur metabolism protein, partial [Nanoarchaeota archaeon]|nr:BolA/IbaG family iron-sulfur metabolism protein [Nanoarchaeota archaeon]
MVRTAQDIKNLLETKLPGAKAQILNPSGDDAHFDAVVTWDGFKGKKLLEQHRIVKNLLMEHIDEGTYLHAFSLKTKS